MTEEKMRKEIFRNERYNKDDLMKDENKSNNSNNSNSNKSSIEIRKELKNKKRKKIKIRAYCNKCYQFFENGPYSKICRNHLKKNCNLIECQKYNKNGDNLCIRKFTNINSANRHTHCLTRKDVDLWDTKYEIQKCLDKKNLIENSKSNNNANNANSNSNNANNASIIINNNNIINNSNNNSMFLNNIFMDNNINNINNNNSFFDNNSQNYFSNNNSNVIGLIEDIDKLHFNDNDNENDNDEIKNILNKNGEGLANEDAAIEKIFESEKFENLSIDDFFEKVQKETNIPDKIKKKLVNAFKKKGILNVKILMLFYHKYKNWDFLIQKFKKVTTQIEGVALCIEFLLKIH